MRYPQTPPADRSSSDAEVPASCPSCGAKDISTTSKVANSESYWRCAACGDVWNAGRRREASRYNYRMPSR
jgi:transposase-like protein